MKILIFSISFWVVAMAFAAERDPAQVRAFRKTHACPSTGKTTGACKGWVVNHRKPLCLGGPDIPENMEWQEYKESLRMDVLEREACRWKDKYEELKKKLEGR